METDSKSNNASGPNRKVKLLTYFLFILAGISACMGVVIMTDIGQLFGIEKPWVVWYFKNSVFIMSISFAFLISAIFLVKKYVGQKNIWTVAIIAIWVLCILSSKYLTPYLMFPAQQDSAEYISILDAKDYLKSEDRVLVVDYNGVQKAYPPEYIWQAHIFGGDFAGDEVVFTYCVITNLASPYLNDLNGETVNFKVLAQTNSNLLIWDTKSDEIIQQITQECEFSKMKLDPIPVLEMTWEGYKKLFPNGTVLYNTWENPIEKTINALFDTDESWNGEKWMFNTVNLDDKRLPSKEHIIGIRDDDQNEQLAFTKAYIKKNGILNITVGNKKLVLAYFPEYETIACFNRIKDGQEINVSKIDVLGQTAEYGKLDRVYIYNSVLWAVWAYYYPNSEVIKL
jgi:hypothetical protein